MTLFAIGHSTRPWPQFLGWLHSHNIETLVDVRTVPRSRNNPHFNWDCLELELPHVGIGYKHLPALGRLRRPRPGTPEATPPVAIVP